MFRIQKILFPTDFSARAAGSAPYVVDMAGRFQAEVHLVNIAGRREDVFFAPEFAGSSLMEQYEKRLREAKQHIKYHLNEEFEQIPTVREVLEGDPAYEITAYAHRHEIDLIMLPTSGLGVFRRLLLGSVTAKVLHDAGCPVWTGVHTDKVSRIEEIAFPRIVCAVDLGPESAAALEWANGFAAEHGAELIALHAVAWEPLAAQSERKLKEILQSLDIEARVVIEEGDPAYVAEQVIKREGATLLVIARGASAEGLGRLRTHEYAIIRSSPCPVVSV
jgi:nucleotide-binding universal stress UspA family protein